MKTYKVIIPYSESAAPKKRFKIEYTVEATNRTSALDKAEKEFNAYTNYNSASWTRNIERDSIRIWKMLPNLPQTPLSIDELAGNLQSADQDIVYNNLKALGEIEDSSASSQILKLFSHENPEIVSLAIETLGQIGDPTNLHAVMGKFKNDTHPRVKASILTTVGKLATTEESVVVFLSEALKDKDSRVRANAVEAIEKLQTNKLTEILLPKLKDEDNRVKANVIKALWNKHENSELLETLQQMASDENPWMKTSAIFVLTKVEIPGRMELLFALSSDPHPKVKENAKKALMEMQDLECIPYWIEIAETIEDEKKISEKILKLGQAAITPLLSFSSKAEKENKFVNNLLNMLEQQVLSSKGWISWLKTKQKRLFPQKKG
jgi:HEAT repeat protein